MKSSVTDQLDELICTNGLESGNPNKLISNEKLQSPTEPVRERDFEGAEPPLKSRIPSDPAPESSAAFSL